VLSSYKRQGIGEKLLQSLVAHGKEKGVENFILEVRISNEPAIALYKKYGFVEIDIRKNYYEQPVEDAYIFQLNLGKE
uniref:GNAT family N-acetyltransferase n=1 Tax=Jeotgalibaca porci TaxID=1868793 RepID=UPI00359F6AE1